MKTLIIIDIQKKYRNSFSDKFVNKINAYLDLKGTEYDKIYCIMEENKKLQGDFLPKTISDKITSYPVFKCYDASHTYEKIKRSQNFTIFEGHILPLVRIADGEFTLNEGNEGYIIGTKDGTAFNLDYINKDLYMLLKSLDGDEISIIGGGIDNCVRRTKNFLKFMDIKSKVLRDFCYTIDKKIAPADERNFDDFKERKNET